MDSLYYRPTSQRFGRRTLKNKLKKFNFLLPFGVIIVMILLLFGLVKVWNFFADMKGTNFENSASVYVLEGATAQKQTYGSSQFFPILSGDILLEGDSVRTLKDTRVVLKFFNDLVVRLDESTSVTVDFVENAKDEEKIEITVNTGNIWLNKPDSLKSSSDLVVRTNYLKANTVGTVFAVKSSLPESVRVIEGTVLVEVIDSTDGKEDVLDQINVNPNQQMTMDNVAFNSFKQRETPRVLSAIDANFKKTNWYRWNLSEDENPSNYESDSALGDSGLISVEDETLNDDDPADADPESTTEENDTEDSSKPKPVVTFPKANEVINTDTVTITGTVPAGTQKVVVNSFEDVTVSPYVLKGFKEGDTTFKYIAKYVPAGGGNLIVGENKFEIIAVDSEGQEGPKTTLRFKVELDGVKPTTPNSSPAAEDLTGLEFSDDLPAPTLVSVNDVSAETGYVLKENRGVVVANIGTWAKSVVVNGYKLQQYTPNSGSFSYILSEGFNTLKVGENKISAYGFDEQGRRGKPMTITIIYKP